MATDRRADIFALGLILNEMFTGSIPQGTGYATVESTSSAFAYLDPLIDRMIQHNPNTRPSSIVEVKKELIARNNDFAALQELNAKRSEVVNVHAAPPIEPVELISVDWADGKLTMVLNRVPDARWVTRFKNPSASQWGGTHGAVPSDFHFQENRATVRADGNIAQRVIEFFKQYLVMATDGYQRDLEKMLREHEQQMREPLAQELAAAEERARVLGSLKI